MHITLSIYDVIVHILKTGLNLPGAKGFELKVFTRQIIATAHGKTDYREVVKSCVPLQLADTMQQYPDKILKHMY